MGGLGFVGGGGGNVIDCNRMVGGRMVMKVYGWVMM